MDFCDISEEGKGETEFRNPCECEALVQFQSNTLAILEDLTEKNILFDTTCIKQWRRGVRLNGNVDMIHICLIYLKKPGIIPWGIMGHIFTMDWTFKNQTYGEPF